METHPFLFWPLVLHRQAERGNFPGRGMMINLEIIKIWRRNAHARRGDGSPSGGCHILGGCWVRAGPQYWSQCHLGTGLASRHTDPQRAASRRHLNLNSTGTSMSSNIFLEEKVVTEIIDLEGRVKAGWKSQKKKDFIFHPDYQGSQQSLLVSFLLSFSFPVNRQFFKVMLPACCALSSNLHNIFLPSVYLY